MQVPDEDRRKIGAYLGLGWGFAATVGMFVALGWFLDRWLDASPAFVLIGSISGGAAAFYYLIRHAQAIQRDFDSADKKADGSSGPVGRSRNEH